MDQLLPDDFKEFLRLLSANRVSYLLVGGYAVGHYGYSRTTGDMDIWIEISPTNAKRIVRALKEFGFRVPELRESLFLSKKSIVRMGVPPLRLEILMDISGVTFSDCYRRRKVVRLQNCSAKLIHFQDLIKNKKASGRYKDLADVEELTRLLRAKKKRR